MGTMVCAQTEKVWIFGRGAGVDFNSGSPVAIPSNITGWGEAAASVCDNAGQLLFYTQGDSVWSRNGTLMPNGIGLTPLVSSTFITSSTSQGALIYPTRDPKKYYIFSLTAAEQGANLGRLYYSVVDMTLNGGQGDIVTGQRGILLDTFLSEHMSAVMGDRCNGWLIVTSRINPRIKAFEITDAGVNHTPVVSIFTTNTGSLLYGKINVSPDRKKIAIARSGPTSLTGSLELYNFDPATGILSDQVFLDMTTGHYGTCFSPDNSRLYDAEAKGKINQYDLSSGNSATIISSKTLLGTAVFTDMKRAPDGKIYFQVNANTLGAITFPNLLGTACQFVPNAVTLLTGKTMNGGLPNVVPVWQRDTLYTSANVQAGCFANVSNLSLQATDISGWDYVWSNGATGTKLSLDTSKRYWVTYHTAPCVLHADTFIVKFPKGVLPQVAAATGCKNVPNGSAYAYTYPGDPTTYNYMWMNSSNSLLSTTDTLKNVVPGRYVLRITTADCDTSLYVDIPEQDTHVSFTPSDTIACMGDVITFQNTSDTGFYRFFWSFADGDTSILKEPEHAYTKAGYYTVMLRGDGNICNDTTYQNIIVDSPLGLSFIADRDSICAGESIVFISNADRSIHDLSWKFGDGTEINNIVANKMQHPYYTAGTYTVTLSAQFRACPDTTFSTTIIVSGYPTVNIGEDTSICTGQAAISLKNLAYNATANTLQWSNGATTNSINVNTPGLYWLKESNGVCATTDSVLVKPGCFIAIPNAFSPNGDGVNDYFFPRDILAQGVRIFHMLIYDRWGQVLFETDQINGRGWDGTSNGDPHSEGVYVYVINATFTNGAEEKYQGNITLIR